MTARLGQEGRDAIGRSVMIAAAMRPRRDTQRLAKARGAQINSSLLEPPSTASMPR